MPRALADRLILTVTITLMLLLSACSSSSVYSPVDERSIGGRTPVRVTTTQRPDQYRVRKGDTLYAIAFRYGVDYRQLARNNGIDSSYSIYPGQTLSFKAAAVQSRSVSARNTQAKPSSQSAKKTTFSPSTAPSKQSKTQSKPQPVVKPQPKSSTTNKATATTAKVAANRTLHWRWPSSGKLLQGFSTKGTENKGINIAGKKGEPVHAAEAGKVVYAGSGLLGYGNLVIINHNQKFLSAYAHNSRILVKENDMVKRGVKIAEIGSSGATRNMLHFEIRRDGQPVNPMKYLPRNR